MTFTESKYCLMKPYFSYIYVYVCTSVFVHVSKLCFTEKKQTNSDLIRTNDAFYRARDSKGFRSYMPGTKDKNQLYSHHTNTSCFTYCVRFPSYIH